jgi:ABC-type transport system involved in multi-copper enzyme maturation permease subunit
MLGTLVRKEILNSVFSFRFVVTFALLVAVVPITIFILTNDYVKKVDEYSFRQNGIENYLKNYAHFNRIGNIIAPSQPPISFYSLVRGISSDVNMNKFDDDPLPVVFPLLDLVFIVGILLSLAALIFSYDAVCGEKEDGTLKLMMSNRLARSEILLGKITGGTLTLLIPFTLSLVLGLFVILLNSRVAWTGTNWATLALVFLGTVIYVFLFLVLGVFISARHHSSSASIMTSLFVWVLLILVVPNLSPYLASLISPAPSQIKMEREVSRLRDVERDDLGRKLQTERLAELVKKYPVLAERFSEAEAKARVEKDPAFREAYQARTREVDAAWSEANRIQSEKARALREDVDRKVEAQTRLSASLSMISPLADFTYLATDLTSTGTMNLVHFRRLSDDIWDPAYGQYVRGRTAALQKQNPAVDWWNTPVDVSDMPRFQYREEALAARVKGTLWPFAIMMMMNLIVFSAAYISFVKYDVR